jgi:hypothetical protein
MMKRFLIEVDSHHIRVCGLVGSADVQVDDMREYDNALDGRRNGCTAQRKRATA